MGLFEKECNYCGSKNHASENCPHERGIFIRETKCRYCDSIEHSSDQCPHERNILYIEKECRYCGSLDHASDTCPHERNILYKETSCGYCGSKEHSSEKCPHERNVFFRETKCTNCGSVDHNKEHCPQSSVFSFNEKKQKDTKSTQSDTHGAQDGTSGASIIAIILGVIAIGFVVVWLAMNIVLPLTIMNSALILTLIALFRKSKKKLFAVLALIGGAFMILDIINEGFSFLFVSKITQSFLWIWVFVYINSAAMALSTWFLISSSIEKVIFLPFANKQKKVILLALSFCLILAVSLIPTLIINKTFAEKFGYSNSPTEVGNNHQRNHNTSYSVSKTQEKSNRSYTGSVGKLSAKFNITWYEDGSMNGTYTYDKRPNQNYILKGKKQANNILNLQEYTGDKLTAYCDLKPDGSCYTGTMINTDGSRFHMHFCPIAEGKIYGTESSTKN